MRVLDLFAGLKGWSSAFPDHDVKTLDIESKFDCDITIDILDFEPGKHLQGWKPDLLLASPPCNAFSVASIGHHWTGGKGAYIPKSDFAVLSKEIVKKTLSIIEELDPMYWLLENPVGVLRKMPFMEGIERRTVTYCQYGENRMKPTDLWGGFPPSLRLRPRCKNGDPCHEAAPRGSKTGTQGLKNAALRAVVPYELSLVVKNAVENDYLLGKRHIIQPTLLDYPSKG